jgi:hypothetical protein
VRPQPRSYALRSRRIPGRWLPTAVITAASAALLIPAISYATASQSNHASQLSLPSQTSAFSQSASCKGITPATFTAQGFITDPARTQGGHTWWRREPAGAGVCVGTVVEFVQYNATTTKTWRVIIYSAQHPNGQVVASRTFTLRRGWYFSSFRIRHAYPGLTAVCITADDSFATPCIHIG